MPLLATGALSTVAVVCIRRLQRHRSRAWRVALSYRHLAVLDVARRQRSVAWKEVEWIDIHADGLHVVARGYDDERICLSISAEFATYAALAHRLVRQAERRRVPIWVEGRPLAGVSVHALFPTLREDLAGVPQR